jgi:hypothetical protein
MHNMKMKTHITCAFSCASIYIYIYREGKGVKWLSLEYVSMNRIDKHKKILLYNWDAHGSHTCDIHERKKNIIMCMHDDSKCLIC